MRDYSEYLQLLEPENVSPFEADRRAHLLLKGQGVVIAELATVENRVYNEEEVLGVIDAECRLTVPDDIPNAPARDAYVVRNPERREKTKQLSSLKARRDFLRRILPLFENAHVFYRQKSRSDGA